MDKTFDKYVESLNKDKQTKATIMLAVRVSKVTCDKLDSFAKLHGKSRAAVHKELLEIAINEVTKSIPKNDNKISNSSVNDSSSNWVNDGVPDSIQTSKE